MKRWIIAIVVIAILAAGGYFGYTYWAAQQQAATLASYQTATAVRGSLTATVGATGTVRANQSALIYWQTSGKVASVLVKAGDVVSADAVLSELAQDSLAQTVILAQTDLVNAQKALEDLQQSDAARASAWSAVLSARQAIIQAERALDRFDQKAYKDQMDQAREDVVTAQDDLKEAQDDFEPYQDWDKDNDTRKKFEDSLSDAEVKFDEAQRVVDLLELEKDQAQAALDQAQAALSDAERAYERIQDGPDPDDVAALQARIDAAQATLELANLEAPFAATVTDVDILENDQVTAGKLALRLDDLSRLLVDVRVSEVDINRVQTGQPARLTFDAILGKEYEGQVIEVANVGASLQGVVEFIVTVELTDADEDVRPGMTAAVNITVEELGNVLMVPNRAVRIVDGQRVVYILANNELQPVRISLGASADNYSEVLDGSLKAGDTIVLNPPLVFEAGGPPAFMR